jgi:hypothetical protein
VALAVVVEKVVKERGRRAALRPMVGAPKNDVDADPARELAPLLHRGDLAVAPDPTNGRDFVFFWRHRADILVRPPEPPPPSVTAPRATPLLPPRPATSDFPPLPAPSGAAPQTCDCLRGAAAQGAPFVAAG